jgi:Recombination endonuclease VII
MSSYSITSSSASLIILPNGELVGLKRSATEDVCGKWMPRAKTNCARKPLHRGECRTPEATADNRQRKTERRRGQTIADPRKRGSKYRLSRYGLTQQMFDQLLEAQGHACAMGREPFTKDSVIFIDHDHACCPKEKSSCGGCVRGLLCLSCNTALGHIERKGDLARAYLANPPALSA